MNLLKNECGANIERFYNLSPTIYIYDGDGTIVDSSHRRLSNSDGSINLEAWEENSTKDLIEKDDIMPLAIQMNQHYKNGDMVIICTADVVPKGSYR
jgi:cupin superfamily acireductone dioxygenase involved in methionine salvage